MWNMQILTLYFVRADAKGLGVSDIIRHPTTFTLSLVVLLKRPLRALVNVSAGEQENLLH
jgi:hypothetical protein